MVAINLLVFLVLLGVIEVIFGAWFRPENHLNNIGVLLMCTSRTSAHTHLARSTA